MHQTFATVTPDEIAGLLNTALDHGEFHSPSCSDIVIKEQNDVVIYGTFKESLHNRYHDRLGFFNINAGAVHIWEKDGTGTWKSCNYRKIYNLPQLATWLIEKHLGAVVSR